MTDIAYSQARAAQLEVDELNRRIRRLVEQNIELQQENERLKRNQKHAYKVLRDGL